jgi:hypothetical protein
MMEKSLRRRKETLMSSKMRLILAVTLSVLGAWFPAAEAAPKILNGGGCHLVTTVTPGYSDPTGTYVPAASASNSTIVCDIPRFTTTNTNGLADLTVAYNTGHGGTGLTCQATSYTATGSQLITKTVNLVGTANTDTTAAFNASVNVSTTASSYYVHCTLPPAGSIRQIRYNE